MVWPRAGLLGRIILKTTGRGAASYTAIIMENLIETLLTTRDFCGDEKDALSVWECENEITLSAEQRAHVWKKLNQEWKKYQIEAGAKNGIFKFG